MNYRFILFFDRIQSILTNHNLHYFYRLLGILILLIILSRIEFDKIIILYNLLDFNYLFYSSVLTIPFFSIKIWRWKYILSKIDIEYSFLNATKSYGAGIFIGLTTPGQVGELVRGVFLSKKGVDLPLATATVILDRFIDLLLLLLLFLPGVFIFLEINVTAFLVAFLMFTFSTIIIILKPTYIMTLKRTIVFKYLYNKIIFPQKFIFEKIKSKKVILSIFSMSVIALFINMARFYLLFLSLKLSMPLGLFILGMVFSSISGLLPITIAGVGIRDAALIIVFAQSNLSAEAAIVFSSLILIVLYGLNLMFGLPAYILETK